MAEIDFDNLKRAREILHVMSPKIRQQLVAHLFDHRHCTVTDLATTFKKSMVIISRHITQLRMAGIISAEKNANALDGRNNYYSLNYSIIDGLHNLSKQIIDVSNKNL